MKNHTITLEAISKYPIKTQLAGAHGKAKRW